MKRCITRFMLERVHSPTVKTAQPDTAHNTAMAAFGFVLLLAIIVVVTPAWSATTLRCDHKLVKVGDPKFIVEEYCGAPLSKDFVGQTTYYKGNRKQKVYIEEWIYEMRYGFYDILTFRGNRLIKMELKQK
ncbi:MAG: DUF2845 domain-containing protein [Pseudomonadota bacterium]